MLNVKKSQVLNLNNNFIPVSTPSTTPVDTLKKFYREDKTEKPNYNPNYSTETKNNSLKLISAIDFLKQPQSLKWLIKGWIPEQSIGMIHGESGIGKTFFVLDMALSIANNHDTWNDCKINGGKVIYLAGEGHHGLRARTSLWKQKKGQNESLDMYISDKSVAFNTTDGQKEIKEAIYSIAEAPKLIIIDTLHRFLEGDESSAQDAGRFIRACEELKNEFKCSILIVHHTGLSTEAQNRARGSSAWRGAMDYEIGLKKGKETGEIIAIQHKMKDAELKKPLHFKLIQNNVYDWRDEEDEPITSMTIEAYTPRYNNGKAKHKHQDHFEKILKYYNYPTQTFEDNPIPVLTKKQVKNYLQNVEGKTATAISTIVSKADKKRLIGGLQKEKFIDISESRNDEECLYIVCDDNWINEISALKEVSNIDIFN